jgi:hypothetical protein
VRSRPPNVKPAARPDPASPSAGLLLSGESDADEWVACGGAGGIGSNGLTPGPLRLLGRLSPAGQGPAVITRASLSLHRRWHKSKAINSTFCEVWATMGRVTRRRWRRRFGWWAWSPRV